MDEQDRKRILDNIERSRFASAKNRFQDSGKTNESAKKNSNKKAEEMFNAVLKNSSATKGVVKKDTNGKAEGRKKADTRSDRLKNDKAPEIEKTDTDIVFESTASENFDYGQGGGRQFFIPGAYEKKADGRLREVDKQSLSVSGDDYKADIRDSEKGNYRIHIDHRGVDSEELADLDRNTPENAEFVNNNKQRIKHYKESTNSKDTNSRRSDKGGYEFHIEHEEVPKDEVADLDRNTPENEALTEVSKNQRYEDYRHPFSDQEEASGYHNPDAWSNHRELRKGERFYQLAEKGNDTKSSYFTDSSTIEECRNKDGSVDGRKLMERLQVKPKERSDYELTQYEYDPVGFPNNKEQISADRSKGTKNLNSDSKNLSLVQSKKKQEIGYGQGM